MREAARSMRSAARPARPPVGIVVPVFRHSALVNDALISALEQDLAESMHVVAVNDGCPHEQTHAVLSEYQLARPDRFTYVRRPNGGLSAARNTGVRWLLRRYSDLEAVYFLDADNRLERGALRRALETLREDDRFGWVYPDIDMFGLAQHWDYGGLYSLLAHKFVNISEAGSLVRADVFRKGVYFDEAMKLGYEDWDFFLSAAELGYIGRSLPDFGFRYRKRAESMLSESERSHAEIRSYMMRKHKALFSPARTIELEQEHAPRYAIYDSARRKIILTTDPAKMSETLSFDEFVRRYWSNRIDPGAQPFPSFLVAASADILEALRQRRVIHWAFWALEELVRESGIGCVGISPEPSTKCEVAVEAVENLTTLPGWRKLTHIMMCSLRLAHEVVADSSSDWINSLLSAAPLVPLRGLVIHSREPAPLRPQLDACWSLLGLINEMKGSQFRDSLNVPRTWKTQGSLDRSLLPLMPWGDSDDGKAPLFPRQRNRTAPSIAFALPLAGFGGAEKVAAQVARGLAAKGFECHLAIWNENMIRADASQLEAFSTVSFLNDSDVGGWGGGRTYLGTELSHWADAARKHNRAVAMLASFDAVVFSHVAAGNAIAAKLRKLGVATLDHIHVTDRTELGRPVGHSHLAVAYEHCFDAILTCSERLADWCEGFGVPHEKIVRVPNAEGFPIDRSRASCIAEARARRSRGALNVLFLGRFDRQKGMERVLAIADGMARGAGEMRLRIVGETLLEKERQVSIAQRASVEWAPASHNAEELCRHYEWADVLLLPSHWEGLPLSVIEAQLFGVAPIVADVGAVSEAVEHGRTGFMLDPRDAVRQALEYLNMLSENPAMLLKISQRAHAAAMTRNWNDSVLPLVHWLERRFR